MKDPLDGIDINALRRETDRYLSQFSARELAYQIANASSQPSQFIFLEYLSRQPESFRTEARRHRDDPLLGEREGDDFSNY